MIPGIEEFERFFKEAEIVRTKPDEPYAYYSESKTREFQGTDLPALYLAFSDGGIKLESVLDKICKELERNGCAADRHIALAVLGLIIESRDPEESFVTHANRCLQQVHKAHLHQTIVYPHKLRLGYRVELGEIELKSFDSKKILYWANKGQCGGSVKLTNLRGTA